MNFIKRVIAFLVLALLLGGLVAFFLWVQTPLAIDRCLDQGRKWDYANDVCEGGRKGS
jgi:hypothetical protein